MSRPSTRAIRSLVAARLREFVEEPETALFAAFAVVLLSLIRPILSLEPIARALASAPETRAPWILLTVPVGIAVGRAASVRLPWSWSRRRRARSARRAGESIPTLPVTSFDRLAATLLTACLLGVPFAASLALSLAWAPGQWRWAALELSCFLVAVCSDIAWNRIDHNRLRAALHLPRALVIPERWRRGEVSAAWWVLLPSTLILAGSSIPFLAPSLTLLLYQLAKLRTEPALNGMMFVVVSTPAMGLLMSGLSRVHAPLTALPVSRRSIALAELRLTPAMLATVGVVPVVMAHVVVGDASFTGRMALVSLALGCTGAIARVALVRVARSSNLVDLRLRVAIPALGGLVAVVAFSASAPPLAVVGFGLLALVCAAGLAYTTSERPLSL